MILDSRYLVAFFLVLECFLESQAFSHTSRPLTKRRNLLESSSDTDSGLTTVPEDAAGEKVQVPLPPVMQHIVDERQEFQINLGRAMDTLRRDMPDILRSKPDFGIYHEDITVEDPSGVRLTGLSSYKSAIAFFQTFIRFWFSSRSSIQYRMVYDFCRSSIRISWNVVLHPRYLGNPVYADGISYYQLDSTSGKIIEHKIEKLIINNNPAAPPYGVFSLLQQDAVSIRQPVPVGVGA